MKEKVPTFVFLWPTVAVWLLVRAHRSSGEIMNTMREISRTVSLRFDCFGHFFFFTLLKATQMAISLN